MQKAMTVHIIVGLGNPGTAYKNTYHNVGMLFVTWLRERQGKEVPSTQPSKKHFSYIKGRPILAWPESTFMNESGIVAREIHDYFKIEPRSMCIAHDDSDMEVGTYKITFDQRSAGHKGVQSIIDTLRTQKFWRIKIGIRPRMEKERKKAEDFVLKKISVADKKIFESVFEKIFSEIAHL